ncbi:hypothetical protein HJFPF1_12708 [Paramyrothecium foliicola]|nr:hypothetical protein HJFPF1_12708 [Paramyrothecium foliicola]
MRWLHFSHLILAGAVSTPAPSSAPGEAHLLVATSRATVLTAIIVGAVVLVAVAGGVGGTGAGAGPEDPAAAEENRLQLAVAAAPSAEANAEAGRGEHGQPPHGVAGDGAVVQRGDHEVEEVDSESEVGDELAAGDEGDDCKGPSTQAKASLLQDSEKRETRHAGRANLHAEAAVEQPDEGQQPPVRRVAAHAIPAEDELKAEAEAGDEGREEHEDEGDGVKGKLQDADLGGDAGGRHLGEGAGTRRFPATRHGDGLVGKSCGGEEGAEDPGGCPSRPLEGMGSDDASAVEKLGLVGWDQRPSAIGGSSSRSTKRIPLESRTSRHEPQARNRDKMLMYFETEPMGRQ